MWTQRDETREFFDCRMLYIFVEFLLALIVILFD